MVLRVLLNNHGDDIARLAGPNQVNELLAVGDGNAIEFGDEVTVPDPSFFCWRRICVAPNSHANSTVMWNILDLKTEKRAGYHPTAAPRLVRWCFVVGDPGERSASIAPA